MATRSTIAVRHADNTVSQIYCHFDGYLDGNGRTLQDCYTTLEAVEQLVAGGDMSSLDSTPDTCVYYTSRGEDLYVRKFDNITEFARNRQDEEYNYLWEQGTWKVRSHYDTDDQWIPLTKALEVA